MGRLLVAVAAVMTAVGAVSAQAPAPAAPPDCSALEFRQFDFWIGRWEVTAGGQVAGTNLIEPILDGCAIAEHWTSASGIRGESLNLYDRTTGQWYQTWTDARGQVLRMTGGLIEDRMVLQTAPVAGADDSVQVQRITWLPLAEGHVRQHWEMSTDGGETWSTVFDGTYVPQ